MRYGDLVTILEDGLRVEPRELEPVGVFERSECWGVWLPNRHHAEGDLATTGLDHLILSPFFPDSWPALFRLDFKLQADTQALVDVTDVLAQQGMNIVAYDCTPSGHSHASWSIIAEAIDLTHGGCVPALVTVRNMKSHLRTFDNRELRSYLQMDIAPAMLAFSGRLLAAVLQANASRGFLHPGFVGGGQKGGSVLFDESQFDPQDSVLVAEATAQRPRPVTCHWLQSLAYFWAYGDFDKGPLPLVYGTRGPFLRPRDEEARERLARRLERFRKGGLILPSRVIAMFDPSEKYARIVLPAAPASSSAVEVQFVYTADFDENRVPSSKGLLNDLFSRFKAQGLRVSHVSSAITHRRRDSETNRVTIVGEVRRPRDQSPEEAERTLAQALQALEREVALLDCRQGGGVVGHRCQCELTVQRGNVKARRVSARELFVSTRYDWGLIETLSTSINQAARRFGFQPRWGKREYETDGAGACGVPGSSEITAKVIEVIRASHAFLLVLPSVFKVDASGARVPNYDMQWILFELGVAIGFGVPMRICVDTGQGIALDAWKKVLKVLGNRELTELDCGKSEQVVMSTIEREIGKLATLPSSE